MAALITFQDVCKYYPMGGGTVVAADHISFEIASGEFTAIVGSSGSGKSTCMNIIGCLDVPSEGTYLLSGQDVGRMNKNQLAEVRNELLGFIFQQYNLLPKLNLLENVEVPLMYAGVPKGERRERAHAALERVGLGDKWRHRPMELSGGQQQRVSIARALVGRPWTPAPAGRCWPCSRTSTARATRWSSSPTTTPSLSRPSGSSGWRTAGWCTTAPPAPRKRWSHPGPRG